MIKKYVPKIIMGSAALLCFTSLSFAAITIETKNSSSYNGSYGYSIKSTNTNTNYKPYESTTTTKTKNNFNLNNNKGQSYKPTSSNSYNISINTKSNTATITNNNSTGYNNTYTIHISKPKPNSTKPNVSKPNVSKPNTTPAPKPTPNGGTNITNGTISSSEKQLLDLINKERRANGLKELKLNTKLFDIAEMKSRDMYTNGYFSHQSPTFGSTFDILKQSGLKYSYTGENIARTQSVSKAHAGFMRSAGHKANILNPKFTQVGIGIVGDRYTELFIAD